MEWGFHLHLFWACQTSLLLCLAKGVAAHHIYKERRELIIKKEVKVFEEPAQLIKDTAETTD